MSRADRTGPVSRSRTFSHAMATTILPDRLGPANGAGLNVPSSWLPRPVSMCRGAGICWFTSRSFFLPYHFGSFSGLPPRSTSRRFHFFLSQSLLRQGRFQLVRTSPARRRLLWSARNHCRTSSVKSPVGMFKAFSAPLPLRSMTGVSTAYATCAAPWVSIGPIFFPIKLKANRRSGSPQPLLSWHGFLSSAHSFPPHPIHHHRHRSIALETVKIRTRKRKRTRQVIQFRWAGFIGRWIRCQGPLPAAIGEP